MIAEKSLAPREPPLPACAARKRELLTIHKQASNLIKIGKDIKLFSSMFQRSLRGNAAVFGCCGFHYPCRQQRLCQPCANYRRSFCTNTHSRPELSPQVVNIEYNTAANLKRVTMEQELRQPCTISLQYNSKLPIAKTRIMS